MKPDKSETQPRRYDSGSNKSPYTGKPKELALKLNVSERTIYNYIHFMKRELKAPIIYNRLKDSYQYEGNCNINFTHNKKSN